MARGGFGWLGDEGALLQCSWYGRSYLAFGQVTPSHGSYAALGVQEQKLQSNEQTVGLDASIALIVHFHYSKSVCAR